MLNLNPALFPLLVISAGFFFLSLKVAGTLSGIPKYIYYVLCFLISIPGFLFSFYYLHLFDGWIGFYQFRSMAGTELLAAGLGGWVGAMASELKQWKFKLFIGLIGFLLIPYIKPVLRPLMYSNLEEKIRNDVCLQSTPSTCGPASAVTLIRHLGGIASEKELAQESYSCSSGTEIWYLARAIRKRGFQVEFSAFDAIPPECAILGTRIHGIGHFIASFGQTEQGVFTVGDPLKGKKTYTSDSFKKDYAKGDLVLIVKKAET